MSLRLNQIVPWGRSFEEYRLMFEMGPADFAQPILGCGDGPAAFNGCATVAGHRVISCDPIYLFDGSQIRQRFDASADPIMAQVRARPEDYVWTHHAGADALLRTRREALDAFLADYPAGRTQGRYVPAALPNLPFVDKAFGLALCSHLLFLYSELLSLEFHLAAIREMCRVAREVRIFPLTSLDCEPSPHVHAAVRHFESGGFIVEIRKVRYQLQRNGDRMIRIYPRQDSNL